MAKVIWMDPALHDFHRILESIENENPIAASKWAIRVTRSVDRLQLFPEMGRQVPEFQDDLCRELIVAPCRIMHKVNEKEEVRILHLRRFEQYFDSELILGMVTEDDEPYPQP